MATSHDQIRRTQALEAQLGRLHSQVGTLGGHVRGIQTGITLNQIPAWDVVRQDSGTFASGDDWDSQFDDESLTNRVQHSLRTAGGEIGHVNCDQSATRLRIRFTSQGASQMQLKLGVVGGDGDNRIQVKANGETQEFSAGGWVTIKQLAPPLTNELILMANGTGLDSFQCALDGLLFDGVNRHWVSY
jgi:hypothetical protein